MTDIEDIRQRDRDTIPRFGNPEGDPLLRAEMDRRALLAMLDEEASANAEWAAEKGVTEREEALQAEVDRLEGELADQTSRELQLRAQLELTDAKLIEKFREETAAGKRRSGLCLLVEQTRKELDSLSRWRIFKRSDAARRLQFALQAKALEDKGFDEDNDK